jgi:hypothetical protein
MRFDFSRRKSYFAVTVTKGSQQNTSITTTADFAVVIFPGMPILVIFRNASRNALKLF